MLWYNFCGNNAVSDIGCVSSLYNKPSPKRFTSKITIMTMCVCFSLNCLIKIPSKKETLILSVAEKFLLENIQTFCLKNN